MEDSVVPLERNLYDHPLGEHGWEKVPNWECLFVNRENGLSYLCMWTISKLAGKKKQNMSPTWKFS